MNLEKRFSAYGDVKCNESLAKHTTFQVGGDCQYFVYPKTNCV